MAGEFAHGNTSPGLSAGSKLADYRIEAQVGAGGMAVVYRARDEQLGRTVALKVMAPGLAADPAFRRRFIRESRAAAAVDHPNILPVFEAGEADGMLFIAMRFVSGGDLRSLAAGDRPLPAVRAAGFIAAAASALDAAHAAGLVHRDVKPANMLVDTQPGQPGHLYLADFGLSKGSLSAASASITGPAEVLGTPDYLAPEQASGSAVDGRADQYALACVAFVLLTGRPVFERDHPMAVVLAHISAPPPSVTARRPDLPAAIDQVLARALAKSPADRYRTCGEFAAGLRQGLSLPPDAGSPAVADSIRPGKAGASAVGHAQTLTAAAKAPQPGGSAGLADPRAGVMHMPAAFTAASAPGSAGQVLSPAAKKRLHQGRRQTVVAAVILLAVCVLGGVSVTWALLSVPSTHVPSASSGRKASQTMRPTSSPGTVAPASQGAASPSSPATQASSPASLTVVCSIPIYPKCSDGPPLTGQFMQVKPATLFLSPDPTYSMINIVWQNWGSAEAIGTGQYATGNCVPDCANESFTYQDGKVLLTDLVPYDGGMAYDDITLEPSGGQTQKFTGTVP